MTPCIYSFSGTLLFHKLDIASYVASSLPSPSLFSTSLQNTAHYYFGGTKMYVKTKKYECICLYTDCALVVFLFSYPYSEDSSQGRQYMNTRCPAWCDRILMSPSGRDLVLKVSLDAPLSVNYLVYCCIYPVGFSITILQSFPSKPHNGK